jgi:hypothetical protein
MSKFATLARGKRNVLTVDLELPDGTLWRVAVQPLTGQEELDAIRAARAGAAADGLADPNPPDTDPVYSLHLMAQVLLLACVDSDDHAAPCFASAEEILTSEHMGRDRIAFLYDAVGTWQDECAPSARRLGPDEMLRVVRAIAEANDALPFVALRRSTQWHLMRTLSRLHASSLTPSSFSGPH